jgi:hypothetical protein
MKEYFLLLILTIAFLNHGFSQNKPIKPDNLKTYGLFGKVYKMQETRCRAVDYFGEPKKDSCLYKQIYTFDLTGNLLSFSKLLYSNGIENFEVGWEWKYDEFNRPVYFKDTNGYGASSYGIITYNTNGHAQYQDRYYSEKNGNYRYTGRYTYEYDDNGRFVKMADYNENGVLRLVFLIKYDVKGNCIETKQIYGDYVSTLKTYKYDFNGNLIEEFEHRIGADVAPNGNFYKKTFEYNKNGFVKKHTEHRTFRGCQNPLELFDEWEYDDFGNKLKQNYNFFSEEKTIGGNYNKYIFDEPGNWTKKSEYREFKADIIEERIIQYYP